MLAGSTSRVCEHHLVGHTGPCETRWTLLRTATQAVTVPSGPPDPYPCGCGDAAGLQELG